MHIVNRPDDANTQVICQNLFPYLCFHTIYMIAYIVVWILNRVKEKKIFSVNIWLKDVEGYPYCKRNTRLQKYFKKH